jgi:hypothetical protein
MLALSLNHEAPADKVTPQAFPRKKADLSNLREGAAPRVSETPHGKLAPNLTRAYRFRLLNLQ